jgi:hypothetical protein
LHTLVVFIKSQIMKTFLAILLCLIAIGAAYSQPITSVHFSVHADTFKIRKYVYQHDTTSKKIKTMFVQMQYNESRITNSKLIEKLNSGLIKIISIDFVYTQFADRKKQNDLNKKRLLELQLIAPNIFWQSMTKWRFFEQLGFTDEKDASLLYHGFVIRYEMLPKYEPASFATIKKDVLTRIKVPIDSTIYHIFKRDTSIDQKLIVIDFTGSMSPYYLEVMAWLALQNFKQNISFSFFNDGDSTDDDKKIIGHTKGIYLFESKNLDTVINYAFKTIKGGYGGDCPENDIEAILKGIEKYKDVKEVVLVADNWSDMRDYSLLYLINKPVKVILCGTDYGINTQYLNLAKKTNGSIHTLNQDLNELYKYKEGAIVQFSGNTFVISGGRFLKIKKD